MGPGAAAPASKPPDDEVEAWSDDRYSLKVTAREGFFCTIRLAAVLPLPPSKTFEVLARPDSHRIFKSITANTYRKVLRWRDQRRGQLQVETEALARWRFAVFSGTFATRLIVDLDQPRGTIDFTLAQPGMMKAFEGHWSVQPYDGSRSLGDIVSGPADQHLAERAREVPSPSANAGPFAGLQRQLAGWAPQAEGTSSLLTLEQSLMPKVVPPGPIGSLVKSISASQVRGMLADLQAEAARINRGAPTPSDSGGLAEEFGLNGGSSGSDSSNRSGSGVSGDHLSAPAAGSTAAAVEHSADGRKQPLHWRAGGILSSNAARAQRRRNSWRAAVGLGL